MGDSNKHPNNEDLRQFAAGSSGMDALMSAIEYQRRNIQLVEAADGKSDRRMYATDAYNMMTSQHQDRISAGDSAHHKEDFEKERLRAAQLGSQAASLYPPHFPTNAMSAGVTNPLWGMNPMLMPFLLPGLRPGLSNPTQPGVLPQSTQWPPKSEETRRIEDESLQTIKCTLCGSPCSSPTDLQAHLIQKHANMPYLPAARQHDRDIPIQSEPVSNRPPDPGETSRSSEHTTALPAGYPGLSYLPHSGLGSTADKPPSVHEAAAKALRYPTPNALNPYLGLPGYQSLLAANPTGLLPSMVPGSSWNPSLAALGYPYSQANLVTRLPYLPQLGQNPLLRMPLGIDVSTASMRPQSRDNMAPKLDSVVLNPRPQSGNFLSNKESLQRRLSAPIMRSTGSPSRMPLRGGLDVNNGGPSYPTFPHRTQLPPQLIAPSVDSSKSNRGPKARIDSKSIEQHISKLISHNEKILHSPTLDKVKPRRVFRRNSLDPASLSNPPHNPLAAHNPLTATLSAPRSIDPKYSKALLDENPQSSDRPNFLMVPSRLADPNPPHSQNVTGDSESARPFVTALPDPRRDPHVRRYMPTMPGDIPNRHTVEPPSRPQGKNLATTHSMQSQMAQRQQYRPSDVSLRCCDCGAQFSKQENYEVHKKSYCQRKNPAAATSSIMRQSVIQHTGLQPGDTSPQSHTSTVPEVKVTPPEPHMEPFVSRKDVTSSSMKNEGVAAMIKSKILENPMRYVHKDIHRTHSADAALQLSRKLQLRQERSVNMDSPPPDILPSTSKILLSPPKTDEPSETPLSSNKSSIPTDKLPPKKKQLQLMRSNSSSKSHLDARRSPTSDLSPLAMTSDTSPMSQGSKTPSEGSPDRLVAGQIPIADVPTSPPQQKLIPPSSLALSATSTRKSLPPWIPLERDDSKIDSEVGALGPAPTIYLPDQTHVGTKSTSSTSPSLLPSPTRVKSPTSPRSPTRKSPGRGSRSPSRSPTSSNLEATIPRSNYKLLLHQLSLRNMQDMGYLSEAYHHSKNKNLKRNIASLLWSSAGSHPVEGGGSPKRSRPFQPDGPKMEELYPGKASLARRLSPNSESRNRSDGLLSPGKTPLTQSRSKPYESNLEVRPPVTRSHSAGYSSDVNNNIKQFLQNKSRNQQQQSSGNPPPQQTKGHKPLTRTNANARFLLKSPTRLGAQDEAKSRDSLLEGHDPLRMRKSLGGIGQSSLDGIGTGAQRLKETLALKRAASYNADSSVDYQSKRQRLIPISTAVSSTTSPSAIPTPLVTSRLNEADQKIKESSGKGESSAMKSVSPSNPVQFNLFPHLNPRFSYEPHPTFCSLVSPQPMYVELEQSTLSMYSQWAVSEPMLLPDGMTVMDLFKNYKKLKGLSPYMSYASQFISATDKKDSLKVTDTKEYEGKTKKKKETEVTEDGSSSSAGSEVDRKVPEISGTTVNNKKQKPEMSDNEKRRKDWIFSRMLSTQLKQEGTCYTSCHNKPSLAKGIRKTNPMLKLVNKDQESATEHKSEQKESPKKLSKLPPPKVIIHPPSPSSSSSSDSNDETPPTSCPKNNEITALEVSDCDSDDDVIKSNQSDHFLSFKKGASATKPTTPSSTDSKSPSMNQNPRIDSHDNKMDVDHDITKETAKQLCHNNDKPLEAEDESSSERQQVTLNNSEGHPSSCHKNNDNRQVSAETRKSDHSHESAEGDDVKGQSSEGGKDDTARKKNKVLKSRRERNAMSPRLIKRGNSPGPNSPSSVFEDPSLAVHPTGACRGASDDPSKVCALCSMKAGDEGCTGVAHSENCEGHGEKNRENLEDSSKGETTNQPNSPVSKTMQDRPTTPVRPHTPTGTRVRTPTSTRPRTPVPLTVSVPKRSRDRAGSKSSKQPLTPGVLDKARGKGTTQHWVTSTDFQITQPKSPKLSDVNDEKPHKTPTESKTDKTPPKIRSFSTPEYFSSMPPNKNPVLDLNLPPKSTETPITTISTSNGGIQALAAVVSGVMRSAAIQSKKKTKNPKHGMTELLSHSRPLIPTSELNGSATKNHARLSEKLGKLDVEQNSAKPTISDSSLGSLASLTAGVGANLAIKQGKPSLRHLSLSTRESELFLNKANETPINSQLERDGEQDGLKQEVKGQQHEVMGANDDHDFDEGQHSDGGKDESSELDGESSANPRPHKCSECKVAFRIAGHLAKHLRSKGHIIAMQKKTLNRLKQQKLTSVTGYEGSSVGQGVNVSGSMIATSSSPEHAQHHQQEELLNQLGDGAETLARAQVRALFEGNEEYAEIATENDPTAAEGGVSDDEAEFVSISATSLAGGSDPRPFKCIACKVAFRFQGHLDRHFRSNMHLLAVGHFERVKESEHGNTLCAEDVQNDGTSSHFVPELQTIEHRNSPNHFLNEISGESGRNLPFVQKPINTELIRSNVQFLETKNDQNNNFIEKSKVPIYEHNHGSRLEEEPVNQPTMECDSLNNMPIKVNCFPKLTKEPINGLSTSHVQPSLKTSDSDSLKSKSIKRQSPVIQSNAKSMFETPPPLPEVPLPSTSPVHNRQQLTC